MEENGESKENRAGVETKQRELTRRLENRRRALKQLAALSGLGAANLLCGRQLKAAVHELVQISQGQQGAVRGAATASKYKPLATATTPKAFPAQDLALLGDLVELIIPTTDTPGARAAGIHWYIDAVAAIEEKLRRALSDGFELLRQRSESQYRRPFRKLTEAQQTAVLTEISALPEGHPGAEFFQLLKQWTLDGYYKSEIGLLQELGWVGHEYLPFFPGCPHPDPSHRRSS